MVSIAFVHREAICDHKSTKLALRIDNDLVWLEGIPPIIESGTFNMIFIKISNYFPKKAKKKKKTAIYR